MPFDDRHQKIHSNEEALDGEGDMADFAATIPSSLEATARDLSAQRRTLLDSLVSAALSGYLHSLRSRIHQISTSTVLLEGAHSGSVFVLCLEQAIFQVVRCPRRERPVDRAMDTAGGGRCYVRVVLRSLKIAGAKLCEG